MWIDNDGIHRVCAGDVEYISARSHTPVQCLVMLLCGGIVMSFQMRIREIDINVETSLRMVSSPAEAWQRAKRLLDAFGKEDHKPNVECRVNAFGYVIWNLEVLGKQNGIAWRIPNGWDTWEGVETMLIEWLTKSYDGQLPRELGVLRQAMRSLPGVPTVLTDDRGF